MIYTQINWDYIRNSKGKLTGIISVISDITKRKKAEKGREKILKALVDDQETISEEIKLFYKKNDLSSILGFLRSLGEFNTRGPLQGGVEHNIGEKLEKKLHIQPPSPVEQFLPIISLPAPLLTIKKELKVIINKAYKKNKVTIHQHVTANSFFRKKSLIGKTQQ